MKSVYFYAAMVILYFVALWIGANGLITLSVVLMILANICAYIGVFNDKSPKHIFLYSFYSAILQSLLIPVWIIYLLLV